MSGKVSRDTIDDGTCCVVCCRNSVRIFAIGECDHPVCFECATRMRVLGAQNECAICRTQLSKVIFVRERLSYARLADGRYPLSDSKHQLYFESDDIRSAYCTLLEHRCKICRIRPSYATFGQLRDHMRREHERHYCDLCVENLTLFTHERKSYSRADLARHRRIGDAEDTSHRGHPLCEFCDERFLDNDELFRHLRREHFYCHFCDADGLHHYYSDYKYLREHFHVEHFLCDDEACRDERFTTAFRTEIDLKAHRATVHNRNLTKAQSKQARTLELEFTIKPRVPGGSASSSGQSSAYASGPGGEARAQDVDGPNHQRRNRRDYGCRRDNGGSSAAAAAGSGRQTDNGGDRLNVTFTGQENRTPDIIELNAEQFPMLGDREVEAASAIGNTRSGSRIDTMARKLAKLNRFTVRSGSSDDALQDTEFPALGPSNGPSSSSLSATFSTAAARPQKSWASSGNVVVKASSSSSSSNRAAPPSAAVAAKNTLTVKLNSKEDFPGLASTTTKKPASVSLQVRRTVVPSKYQNGTSSDSTTTTKRQSQQSPAVVTKMTGSQNVTFLGVHQKQNATKMGTNKSTPAGGSEGWVILKKGDKNPVQKRANATGGSGSKAKANDVGKDDDDDDDDDDFPALETKMNKEFSGVTTTTSDVPTKSKDKKQLKSSVNVPKVGTVSADKNESAVGTETGRPGRMIENEENEFPESPSSMASLPMDVGFNGMSVEHFPDMRTTKKSKPHSRSSSSAAAVDDLSSWPSATPPPPPPPGFANLKSHQTVGPPPGFRAPTSNPNPNPNPPPPPPGFLRGIAPSASSSSSSSSDVTFTNSIGEKYTFATTTSMMVRPSEYHQPDGFQARNQRLMERLSEILDDKDKFNTFRLLSGYFRKGEIAAAEYYAECRDILGGDEFSAIFPELLVLLPDIQKQQLLLAFHKASQKQQQQQLLRGDNANKKRESTVPAAATTSTTTTTSLARQILVCAACQQVLSVNDFRAHMDHHSLDDDFPSLLGAGVGSVVRSKKPTWVERS